MSAVSAPAISFPQSDQCCRVSIINSTCDLTVPLGLLAAPATQGLDYLNLPTYAFHIKHDKSGREVLFDLGCRKDWYNHVPHVRDMLSNSIPGLSVRKDVLEIVAEGGIDVGSLEALVLSHWHFDHCGAISAMPKSMRLIVGQGFKDEFLPGYPAKESSAFHEADFEGRDVIEVPFSGTEIGTFQSYDYFGDGSFYILDTPGHATGHISALARTTPDTFVLLGGDVCHCTGMIRPTEYIPMPDEVPSDAALDERLPRPCLCSGFLSAHKDQENARTTPFLGPAEGGATINPEMARQSISAVQVFDADPNILVAIAHDPTSLEVFDFFPATLNDWKQKNWKQRVHWGFLSELPYNGKTVRPTLVDGLYKDGVKVRGLELA